MALSPKNSYRPNTRWYSAAIALVVALTLALFSAPAAQAAGDPSDDIVRNVDIAIKLDADGIAHVKETYTWDFGDRDGLGFYRTLVQYLGWDKDPDKMRQYKYSNFEVSSPSGAPAEVWVDDESGSIIKLAVGAPDNSNETRTGVQKYVLSYDVAGSLNAIRDQSGVEDQDEFFWNILTDWDVLIEKANVTITGPADVVDSACYQGPYGSTDPCTSHSAKGRTATLKAVDLPAGDGFTVMAGYPAGTFANTDPILVDNTSGSWGGSDDPWEDWITGDAGPVGNWVGKNWPWLAGLWAAVLGAVGYGRWRKGRDLHYVGLPPNLVPLAGTESQHPVAPLTHEPPVTVQFHPPEGITPAEAGVLLEERANPNHITATIVDLAVRGYLTIEEVGKTIFGKTNDWRLSRVENAPSAAGLTPYESALLKDLLGGRFFVDISDLRGAFESKVRKYTGGLTKVSDANGWYTRTGLVGGSGAGGMQVIRIVFFLAFFFIMFAGGSSLMWIFTAGPGALSPILLLIFAIISLAIVFFATGKMAHARSANGRALYEQVRGFRQYLTTAEAHQLRWEQGEDIFSKYLPWAMVFGVADRWAKMFEQLAAEGLYTTQPIWYVSSQPFSPSSFRTLGSSMSTFASSASQSLSYTPGSSGGSGSFGGGGGFSGGGGGGGGGGGR